ncbi:MAG TPA: nitroreductase family protein [Thermoplasmata archaeon]|nr:nitroreductase family protein [Thermoplasmata archaeon]
MLRTGGPSTTEQLGPSAGADRRMSALEAIAGRTSVRSFQYREVEDALLLGFLKAAVRAPIALERETWAFLIVQDRVLLRTISNRAKDLWAAEAQSRGVPSANRGGGAGEHGDAERSIFHNAGTLVVVGARSNDPYADAECWLAAENLMIAATALGLGTCLVGAAVSALSDPSIRSALGVSPAFRPIVPIVVGYPRDRPTPKVRRDPDIVAWRR